MAGPYDGQRFEDGTAFGTDAMTWAAQDVNLPSNVKAVTFDADGTISFKNAAGTTRASYPVLKGVPLTFVPARITVITGPTACWLTL